MLLILLARLCLGSLSKRTRCNENDSQRAIQQFLQIFPTILSARLFS